MTKKIMIVEDNELNMKLFRDLLQSLNYQTIEIRSGVNALERAREERPDLVIMDIQLPGISGIEVTKMLKQDSELAKIPVIAVTAFAMKNEEERILESGCEAYMSKPIAISNFLELVKQYLT